MRMIHTSCPKHENATLEGYILDCEILLGQETKRPAIIVCPGGGYVYCSPRESEPVAIAFAGMGYHAFLLRYSTGKDAADFAPLDDLNWTIGYVREHAEEWNIDPEKILVCGFSAGGHLAMASAVLGEHKPNGLILGYPVIDIPSYKGADFMFRLLTGKENYSQEDTKRFNLTNRITKEAPPVFMFATAQDLLTPSGVLSVANTYTKLGLEYELHIFQHGPHGMSLANPVSCDGSSQILNEAFAHWPTLCNLWIQKVYGELQFENRSAGQMMKHLEALGYKTPSPQDMENTKFG